MNNHRIFPTSIRPIVAAVSLFVALSFGTTVAAQWSGDATTQDFPGSVGVGLTYPATPAAKLEVSNPTGGAGSFMQITGSTADNTHNPEVVFKGGNAPGMILYPAVRLSNAGYALVLWGGYSNTVNPIATVVDSGSQSFYLVRALTGVVPFRAWGSGTVGIGTGNTPAATLDVRGTPQVTGTARRNVLAFDSNSFAQGVGGGISFGGNVGTDGGGNPIAALDFANISGVKENATASNNAGALVFSTRANNVNPAERMRISSDGLVIVGASGGTGTKLTVNGDINVTGNINAKYQDVAEWVDAAQPMSAGTVVVVDLAMINRVATAAEAYSTRVAGVVSQKPGLILGESGPTKVMVATTGRVKVKVDATKRPVAIGDLLVSSDKPGLAMVSEPVDLGGVKIHRPGTLIGKALEPLASGEGEVLVLLSMQ